MIRFTVVTIFPEMFESVLSASVLGRAREAGLVSVDFVDPRSFTSDRHRTVDDAPYGGGPGMVMKVEPLVAAIESIESIASIATPSHRILMSPVGAPLSQKRVQQLARLEHITLVCGRYEGIDERVSQLCIDEELSLGDFVLTGGEVAAMALIDAVARYVPGVLGEATSTDEESFSGSLLEYPQYTRPAEFRGHGVPDILLSGHHARIAEWRRAQSIARTAERRPDLLAEHAFTAADRRVWSELGPAALARRTHIALVHYPVYDRNRDVVTSAVTNLDIHDIARSCVTYGLAGYHVVTPVSAQRDKVERIVSVWKNGISQSGADNRADALASVRSAASIDEVVAALATTPATTPATKVSSPSESVDAAEPSGRPLCVATSAQVRESGPPAIGFAELVALASEQRDRPLLILFGTGWGLTEGALARCDAVLRPITGVPEFNHLSVRSAVAAVLDRLFGIRGHSRT